MKISKFQNRALHITSFSNVDNNPVYIDIKIIMLKGSWSDNRSCMK